MLQLNRSHFLLSVAAWGGMLQFGFCLYVAMQLYGGGYEEIPQSAGYSLEQNFLSDLGRTVSWSGGLNPSCDLFNGSVVVLGVTLLAFFVGVPADSAASPISVRLFGALSACGVTGIGFTPYDKFFVAHHVALVMWLGPMLLLLISFIVSSRENGTASTITRGVAVAVIVAVFAYALAFSRHGNVVMQKVTAGLAVAWFLAIASPISPVFRTAVGYISEQRLLAERQAVKYMARLERGYRLPCNPPRQPGT